MSAVEPPVHHLTASPTSPFLEWQLRKKTPLHGRYFWLLYSRPSVASLPMHIIITVHRTILYLADRYLGSLRRQVAGMDVSQVNYVHLQVM
jgi:hypothetical protein